MSHSKLKFRSSLNTRSKHLQQLNVQPHAPEPTTQSTRNQTVKFTKVVKTRKKKPLFPNPFADGFDNYKREESPSLESYFKRKAHSKYLIPSETPLLRMEEIPRLHKSRSMFELAVEHILDSVVLDETKYDKVAKSITSIDEKLDRKSKPTSMIFDHDPPSTKARHNTYKKPYVNTLTDSRILDRKESQNMLLEGKVKKAQEGMPIRRKSCSCKDCGLNQKLAKTSTLRVTVNRNDLQSLKIEIPTPREDGKGKTPSLRTGKRMGSMRLKGPTNRASGSTPSGQLAQLNQFLGSGRMLNLPRTPLELNRSARDANLPLERRKSSITPRDPSVLSKTSNSPSPGPEMKNESFQFFMMKAVQSQDTGSQLMMPSNNKEESRQAISYSIDEWERRANNNSPMMLRIDEKPTEYSLSPMMVKPKAKQMQDFTRRESPEPIIMFGKTDDVLETGTQKTKDTQSSRRKLPVYHALAQIIGTPKPFDVTEQPPLTKSSTNLSRSKNNTTAELNVSNKFLDRSVREVLAKTGQHFGLLASMNKTKKSSKKPSKIPSPSRVKTDQSLPYLTYISHNRSLLTILSY